MPTLPLIAPGELDLAGALWSPQAPTSTQPTNGGATWTNNTGGPLLFGAISVNVLTGGAAGSRIPRLTMTDQDLNTLIDYSASDAGIPASQSWVFTFAIGLGFQATTSISGVGVVGAPLPWVVLMPGWSWDFHLDNSGGLAAFNGSPFAVALEFDGAGGGTGPVPIGPYLYVPGPDESVAA